MTSARFEAIEEIFCSALRQPPEERAPFLAFACGTDEVLRSQVELLLACHPRVGDFIEIPVASLATSVLKHTEPELLIGRTIAHYELVERIGAGGMGEVYLARDIIAGRKAALKLLPQQFTADPQRLERFEREARAVAALNHPNILTVYEIGLAGATHYIASELIEGETLRQRLARGVIPVNETLEITLQVGSALAAAHDAGIVHRDIKPENIMLRPDGYVKVLDFGIAKLAEQELRATTNGQDSHLLTQTRLGSIIGTLRYMSPEQARGEPVTSSSDIWSLGIVLSEMLTVEGRLRGRRSIPAKLQRLLARMLAKRPNERFSSGGDLVEELRRVRKLLELRPHSRKSGILMAAAVVAAAGAITLPSYLYYQGTPNSLPDKSIAVLPFDNLSDDRQDSYFAVGVQDEILSDLVRIADLKVVSRTSASSYVPRKRRNSREIGQQLGVAYLLEGTVQRIAQRVRIHAQLIDSRTDSHRWAQTYDRDVSDLFAIQSEIAQTIADQLQSKISERERATIAHAPTRNLLANQFYRQAVALESQGTDQQSMLKGVSLLGQALARDPRFVRAYCALARMHMNLYEEDHSANELQAAKAAMEEAAKLQPEAGELHLVRAHYLFRAMRQYDDARGELELARRSLPNEPAVYHESALIDRRQGRWSEALRNFKRAVELDPRNPQYLSDTASTYHDLHRYAEATQLYRHTLGLSPDNGTRMLVAWIPFEERADIRPAQDEIESILSEDPNATADVAEYWWSCAMLTRDVNAADRALAAIPPEGSHGYSGFVLPREFEVGYTAQLFNRPDIAHAAFATARDILEKHLREQPDEALGWGLLGRVKAALGEKQEAIAAGRHACDIWPLSKEPVWGLVAVRILAKIYAAVGEKDLALQQLSLCAGQPSPLHYGELKLDPDWTSVRGDPRFEEIVASFAPKDG